MCGPALTAACNAGALACPTTAVDKLAELLANRSLPPHPHGYEAPGGYRLRRKARDMAFALPGSQGRCQWRRYLLGLWRAAMWRP